MKKSWLCLIWVVGIFAGCKTTEVHPNIEEDKGFFPIYNITLGRSTVKDIKELGYKCDNNSCRAETLAFWDHNSDGIVESIYITNGAKIPDKWIENFGFRWSLSYNQWIRLFQEMGFRIEVEKDPAMEIYEERETLSANFTAFSPDGQLEFEMDFDYGNDNGEGSDTNARYSLYSISVKANR